MSDDDGLRSVCPQCGSPFTRQDTAARCTDCQPARRDYPDTAKPSSARRGYDHAWRKLSERARRLQPFCSDCGAVDDLTADHSPEAWDRVTAGQVIRLSDIAVVCRRCNTDRGRARGMTPADLARRDALIGSTLAELDAIDERRSRRRHPAGRRRHQGGTRDPGAVTRTLDASDPQW